MEGGNFNAILGGRPVRILLIEDSEDDAFLLHSELSSRCGQVECQRVDTATDMASALVQDEWDVIVCDHNMPGFDSAEALGVLKRSGKDIPFIIYSGQFSDQQASAAMTEGVCDYVPKGNLARLIPVLERELRGAAVRKAVRQADHRIIELSYYDGLSHLPNHTLFCARLTEWVYEALRSGGAARGALFYIDIDRFMRINSSFGYEAGNDILRQVARRLTECADQHAMVARLSGDEFGIFYPHLNGTDAVVGFAAWILQAFDAPFASRDIELYLTPSIGITIVPSDGQEVYELLSNAATAMACAKRAGGNSYRFYSRDMNATSADRLALESDLRHAVERGELFVQYQPAVSAKTRRILAAEALVRWRHPSRGLILPDRFIPIADESGLIVDIGEWVLRCACEQGRQWHAAGHREVGVSVNVSAVQFAQPRLLEAVRRALADTGFRPQFLELEITESVLMHDAETTIGMLRALTKMGVRISVDDFGTGYSSLSYLKRFPIDVLKIDKSFVTNVCIDQEDAAIVRAMLALARSLHLDAVAEGVETAAQVDFLQRENCDRFQGFFFSRPVDPEILTARLGSERDVVTEVLN